MREEINFKGADRELDFWLISILCGITQTQVKKYVQVAFVLTYVRHIQYKTRLICFRLNGPNFFPI